MCQGRGNKLSEILKEFRTIEEVGRGYCLSSVKMPSSSMVPVRYWAGMVKVSPVNREAGK